MKKYWLHRISHESDVSYKLLDLGYLTIGWSMFSDTDVLDHAVMEEDLSFRKFTEKHGIKNRSRWNLWNFAKFSKGDIVVVPMYNKMFGVYEVLDPAKSILDLAPLDFKSTSNDKIEITEDGIKNINKDRLIDLGFYIKVKKINITERNNATSSLISRMKMRQTNGDITDLAEDVELAKTADRPIDIHGEIMDLVSESFMANDLFSKYTPDKVELLVKLYFETIGASKVYIPAKNSAEKKENADADVIAEFDDLNLVFYVQVKHHKGKTDSWAIEQINTYTEDLEDQEDKTTHIPWALTTAEFNDQAKIQAEDYKIRLIDGDEFVRMLLNAGVQNLDNID